MNHQDVDPRDLKPNPWNTNVVNPENMLKLATSLERFGWVRPILTRSLPDGSLEILGGEHRAETAISLGHETVPVIILDGIDDRRAKEIGLIDNARYGADDATGLASLLEELGGHDVVAYLPFSDEELATLTTTIDIDLDSLGFEKPEAEPDDKRPPKTHTVMRFKVPIEDADDVANLISRIQSEQGFTESDSLTNAGDALTWLSDSYSKGGRL